MSTRKHGINVQYLYDKTLNRGLVSFNKKELSKNKNYIYQQRKYWLNYWNTFFYYLFILTQITAHEVHY